jgi:glucose dehydrogenase
MVLSTSFPEKAEKWTYMKNIQNHFRLRNLSCRHLSGRNQDRFKYQVRRRTLHTGNDGTLVDIHKNYKKKIVKMGKFSTRSRSYEKLQIN